MSAKINLAEATSEVLKANSLRALRELISTLADDPPPKQRSPNESSIAARWLDVIQLKQMAAANYRRLLHWPVTAIQHRND